MDVSFNSAELARLCNSEQLLTRRFGAQIGRTVARRLCDLAAVDASTLDQLPETLVMADGTGQVQLSLGESVLVRGLIASTAHPRLGRDGDGLLITSVNVEGTEVR